MKKEKIIQAKVYQTDNNTGIDITVNDVNYYMFVEDDHLHIMSYDRDRAIQQENITISHGGKPNGGEGFRVSSVKLINDDLKNFLERIVDDAILDDL